MAHYDISTNLTSFSRKFCLMKPKSQDQRTSSVRHILKAISSFIENEPLGFPVGSSHDPLQQLTPYLQHGVLFTVSHVLRA